MEYNSAEAYFSVDSLSAYFRTHLINRNGGGRDGMQPKVFWKNYRDTMPIISSKCISGKFKFSPYKEHLILKRRNKLPRVISVPTVRDRIVLGCLNDFLQFVFSDCVCHNVPNQIIGNVISYINFHKSEKLLYLKSDFVSFYDSIRHETLINKLRTRIKDEWIIQLIISAIKTPTVSGSSEGTPNRIGVPQGLAISNILASIYMKEFDDSISNMGDIMYVRYVDDILILQPLWIVSIRGIKRLIRKQKLGLYFSKEKTTHGELGIKPLDFIGYLFLPNHLVSVRNKNVNRMINKLASVCTMFKKEYKNPHRLLFNGDDSKYMDYFVYEINLIISGFKHESHCFGWVPYYRSMNDLSLLYRLDKILRDRLLPHEVEKSKIHKFVQSYYELMNHGGGRLILNLNEIVTIPNRTAFLRKIGLISIDKEYSDDEINAIFENFVRSKKRQFEENIGYV